jgi:hypothetical protein
MNIERSVRVVFRSVTVLHARQTLQTAEQDVASATLLQRIGFKINCHWKFMSKYLSQPMLPEQPAQGESDLGCEREEKVSKIGEIAFTAFSHGPAFSPDPVLSLLFQ